MRLWRAIKLLLFLNCRHAAPLISHAMDHKLPVEDRAAVAVHLMGCNHCRGYRGQLVLLRHIFNSLATAPPRTNLSPEARARIHSMLQRNQ